MSTRPNIDFDLKFTLDKDGIEKAKQEIKRLQQELQQYGEKNHMEDGLKRAQQAAAALEKALGKAYNANIGKMNMDEFVSSIHKAGFTVGGLEKTLSDVGVKGGNAFNSIHYEIDKMGLKVKETNKTLDKMFTTLLNTANWKIASTIVNEFEGSIQRALGFTKALDNSLNNIRIVTGKSSLEMQKFSKEANDAAKVLGKSTTEYTDASLIFFQQGKTAEEVKALTEATLMGANVTGTDVSEMADLLTAVMNGYNKAANDALEVTDKLAAVGAGTGADFEELAKGMSKVASMANVTGVSIDQLNAQLATITTVTREAPESIGTSLKTIFGRMSELKAGKEDEEGWTAGKVEDTFKKIGMTVFDANGQMRDLGVTVEMVGNNWQNFDKNTQLALANALAGQRQANRLIALFDNWSMYLDSLNMSQEALGTTIEQNEIRTDSYAYQAKQLTANLEELWMKMINEDTLKDGLGLLNGVLDKVNDVVDVLGGAKGTLHMIGSLGILVFQKQLGGALQNFSTSFRNETKEMQRNLGAMGIFRKRDPNTSYTPQNAIEENILADQKAMNDLADKEYLIKKNLSAEEHKRFKLLKETIAEEHRKSVALRVQVEEAQAYVEAVKAGHDLPDDEEFTKKRIQTYKKEIEALQKQQLEIDKINEGSSRTTLKREELNKALEKNLQLEQKIMALKDPKTGKIKEADVERLINSEIELRKEKIEGINKVREKGLDQLQREYDIQERNNAKLEVQSNKEIEDMEKRATRNQNFQTAVASIGTILTATGGVMSAMKAYEKAAGDLEEENTAIVTGFTSVGGALMMLPSPWAKLAGAVVMAAGALAKYVRENYGITGIMADNAKMIENYTEKMNKLRDASKKLEESQGNLSKAYAMADDGLDPTELEEYNTIIKDVASNTPELIDYYDAYGNAVLKSREEIDKMNESLKEQMKIESQRVTSSAGSFATEVAYLKSQGEARKKSLQSSIDSMQDEIDKMYIEGASQKSITKKQEKLSELYLEMSELEERFSGLDKKAQDTLVTPFIEANDVFKELGKEVQGFTTGLFNAKDIEEGLDRLLGEGTHTTEELKSMSDNYIESFKTGVLTVAESFSEIQNSAKYGDQVAQEALNRLSSLPVEAQKLIGKQMISLGINLDQAGIVEQLKKVSGFINEQGELDSFGLLKYFREVGETAKQEMLNAVQDVLDQTKTLLEQEGGQINELLIEQLSKVKAQKNIGRGVMIDNPIYDEIQNAIKALQDGNMELFYQIYESDEKVKEEIRSKVEYLADDHWWSFLSDNEAKQFQELEKTLELYDKVGVQQELINSEMQVQNMIYDENIAKIAETTQGYEDMANLWNSMVEASTEVGEGGLFSIDLEQLYAENEALEEQVSAFEGVNSRANELGTSIDALGESSENLKNNAIKVGEAFQSMTSDIGEDKFAQIAEMMGRSVEDVRSLADEAAKGSVTAARTLQQEMGKVYASMNANNKEYFDNFKKVNQDKLSVVAQATGIEAKNYKTLAEYQEQLEIWKSSNVGTYAQWQVKTVQEALQQRVQDELKAGEKSVEINGKSIDASTRAASIAQLMVAKAAVEAARQGGEGGRRAAADMISGLEAANEAVGATLGNISRWLKTQGNQFDAILSAIDAEIQKYAAEGQGLKAIKLEGVTVPTFDDFTYTAPSGSISLPSYGGSEGPTTGTQGPSATGDGGGGDKDSGAEKEVEDLEWVKDIYHDINVELEQKSALLDKLKKQQDKLYGKELLDNLAKQKTLLEEQQKLLERKLQMQRDDLAQQRSSLKVQGVQFNVDGTISNYNQLLEQKVNYVNSLSGEAKEAAKEEFQSLVSMMEAYEQMMLNTIIETENAIQESIDAQREIFLQEFEYSIQLKIEMSDDLQKAADFMKDINDEYKDFSDNYERTTKQISDQVNLIEKLSIKLKDIENNPGLSTKERLELLEKYNQELQDAVKELDSLNDELTKLFTGALSEGLSMVKDHISAFKNVNSELKSLEQIMKLIGEGENYAALDSIYEQQYKALMGQVNVLNAQMAVLQKQKEDLEKAGMIGTDEWKALDAAIKQTQTDINALATESLKLLQDEFKNSVKEILGSLESQMTGGKTFDEIKKLQNETKKNQKEYLDGEERLLAISKLQEKVQKEIDSTDDPAKRAELQKFMDTELKSLKDKDKLSKYEIDRANLLYDLTLKQMALEDQRATKNIMRLVRDTQGNWVYEFTEDAKAIEKAQEDLSSSMEKLLELDKKRLEETQEEMLKRQEEYYKEVQQITNDALAGKYKSEDEVREALAKANEKYQQDMLGLTSKFEEAKKNASITSMAIILQNFDQTKGELLGLNQEQIDAMKKLSESTKGSFSEMSEAITKILNGDDDESLKSQLGLFGEEGDNVLQNLKDSFNIVSTDMASQWGIDIGNMISEFAKEDNPNSFINQTNSALNSIMDKWKEYQEKVKDVQNNTGTSLGDITDKIQNAGTVTDDLNSKTNGLIDTFAREIEQLTKLTASFQKNRDEISKNIQETINYINKINDLIATIKKKNDVENTPAPPPPTPTPPPSSGSGSGSGSSTPKPSTSVGSKVRLKSGRKWYYDSAGMNPSGDVWANQDLLITLTNPGSKYPLNVGKRAGEYLGWIKQDDIVGYDTGGYTGDWGKDGRLAMLHEKELVLNKADTPNILDAVKVVRDLQNNSMSDIISNISRNMISALVDNFKSLGQIFNGVNEETKQEIKQEININADFSGVTSADEIKKAFSEMSNTVSQYVMRKN